MQACATAGVFTENVVMNNKLNDSYARSLNCAHCSLKRSDCQIDHHLLGDPIHPDQW